MCVVAAIPIAIALAGAAVKVVGDKQAADKADEVDRFNQSTATAAGRDAVARGNQAAAVARMRASSLIGEQQVAYAASGVDIGVGTPAATMAQTRMLSELDAQTIHNNAAREAWGYEVKGMQYGEQANLDNSRANYQTASTILGAASTAASMYSSSKG